MHLALAMIRDAINDGTNDPLALIELIKYYLADAGFPTDDWQDDDV